MLNNLILFMVLMGLKLRESFIIGRLPCYSEPIKFLYLHESLLRLNIGCMFLVRLFGCLVLLLICIDGSAQITGVVFDMETKRQIAGVRVYINPKGTVITDSRGRFVISQPCNGVTFSHVSYESRAYSRKELCDTIWLMPKLNRLDEVVITAKAPIVCIKKGEVSKYAKQFKAPSGLFSFDMFKLFDFKGHKHEKRRKRLEKILEDY